MTIEIDSMDKVGGFVGYLIVNGVNMSIELVKQGLSKVHYSGEQGKYANQLLKAQTDAQQAKLNIWKDWEPPKEVEEVVPAGPVEVKFFSFEIRKPKVEVDTPVEKSANKNLHYSSQLRAMSTMRKS